MAKKISASLTTTTTASEASSAASRQSALAAELREKVDTLLSALREQLHYAQRVAALAKRRAQAVAAGRLHERDLCLDLQREVLQDYFLVERERIACLAEIGLLLGSERPSRVRIAQLVLFVEPEQRDELLEVRESLRDVADCLESLRAWGGRLDHPSAGRVTLFIEPETESPSRHWLREHFDRLRRNAGSSGSADPSRPPLAESSDD